MGKFFFLSIAGCVLVPSVAFASPNVEYRVARVNFSDLNITTIAGQKALDRRLQRAASAVCGTDTSDPFAQGASYRCKRKALADARSQMNDAVTFALQNRGGAPVVLASR